MMEVPKSVTLVLTFFIMGICATNSDIDEFLIDNGYHYVDLFYNSSNWRMISHKDLHVATLSFEDIAKAHDNSFGIFIFDMTKDDLIKYLSAITKRKIKMSLLVLSEQWDNEKIDLIKNYLVHLGDTSFFYIAVPTKNSTYMTWHHIISLNSGSVLI